MESVKIATGLGGHGPQNILYSSRQPIPGHSVHPVTSRLVFTV